MDSGIRLVALFEGVKGALVIVAGFGLLGLIHHDVQGIAEDLVRHFHLNPASKFPRIFLDAAATTTDSRLWALAMTALAYALVRFVEAYGLWRRQTWAEWFAILSGSIYLPIEIHALTLSVTPVKMVVLAINLFIVIWLSLVRWQARGKR